MKKLILMIVILVLIFSVNVSAKTNLEFSMGAIGGENISDDFIPGGQLKIITDKYNYKEVYDFIEFSSNFGSGDSDYNFISSDLILYSQIRDLDLKNKYVGIGVKQLFLDNSQASNFIFDSDITAYGVPLAFKAKENFGQSKLFFIGTIFKGVYNMTVPGEDAASDFNGFSIDLGLKLKMNDLNFKLSYKQEDYSFDRDKDVIGAENFTDDYKGLFLGFYF
ncbi:hypothetical protein [Halanaerobacter jeridensis]|uniref:Outer membrane protein beta-barrel domain-containing protein n=1 Tax=Halanaerobacter jeridensis TaxID=706427 RepID=A0A938XUF8_9FIRM|nr:hypothetical protein [Halanaerobacter jeridensis]MBM7557725.1 hypothetical protein [Halanaerobacter jeridensis]